MKKIAIAVIAAVSGLNVLAGAAELGGVRAGGVAALAESAGIAVPTASPAIERGLLDKVQESYYFFYAKDQASGTARLKLYVEALRKAGISVAKAEVVDAGGVTQCNIAYNGPERIFKIEKSFPGALSMNMAKSEFAKKKAELDRSGAVVIEGGAVLTNDGYGKVSVYTIVYISPR